MVYQKETLRINGRCIRNGQEFEEEQDDYKMMFDAIHGQCQI